jgi:pyridoxamine 5'-phosphate oxidase
MASTNSDQVAAMRARYIDAGLAESDLAADPIVQFDRWFTDVVELGLPEPNAMILATVNEKSEPSTRHVLLKGFGPDGFVFYTNYGSRKARELEANPQASLCFPWFVMQRQVVVTGHVSKVTRSQTEAYFATRPRGSQLGAWASEHQSEVVTSRAELDAAFDEVACRFPVGTDVPAPTFWGGFAVLPAEIEFWQGRDSRMHDRLRYRRLVGGGWAVDRRAP